MKRVIWVCTVIRLMKSRKPLLTRSPHSNRRGASLGIFFRGRYNPEIEDAYVHCGTIACEGQEKWWKARAGQYHELLREEMKRKVGTL